MTIKIQMPIKAYRLATPGSEPAPTGFVAAEDRRLSIEKVPELSGVLRWEKRPRLAGGNPSWTYMVDAPGGAFGITIGHVQNGHASPFEVWVNGDRAPRGLSSLAKSISMDMRSLDRGWLAKKLEALQKVSGEPFVLPMPDGSEVLVNSPVDAFARLIQYRCAELGAFDQAGHDALVRSMMSAKEPKTTAEGTLSWTVDVVNPMTGDDFCLFLKEAQLPNGQRRPFSLWLSGDYPRSLDGLCKSLSLDMRIVDVGWVLQKLEQLQDVSEHKAEFRAQVPGTEKTQWYPSTVAYIAALVQHRFKVHGYCDDRGVPTGRTVLSVIDNKALKDAGPEASPKHHVACSACGAVGTLTKSGGCEVCAACGSSKCQ